ncbi:MAG: hypothetical protein NTU44_01480 [Bacteroidetes bacterium]|nr:hypothetical protein [Bacteroidota bacterium]
MMKSDHREKFLTLRDQYPFLCFENFSIQQSQGNLLIKFVFNLSDHHLFEPTLQIPLRPFYKDLQNITKDPVFQYLVFQVGMTELISYWKAACPSMVIINPYHLSEKTANWWKKLYYHGLGEFLYTNSISLAEDELMTIESSDIPQPLMPEPEWTDDYLVPVGGGKDSAVTIEVLRKVVRIRPFLLNPREAMTKTIETAGFSTEDSVVFHRTIDPGLLKLNAMGYLNGHTPFSALLAFMGLLASRLTGFRNIALSNEASANEVTIPGTTINHQYSKSYEFEQDFNNYITDILRFPANYFSFLRPLPEIRIASLFSKMPQYFPVFKSCNVGSKDDSWCGHCPKCLFAYVILSPFLESKALKAIFGRDLFENEKQWDHLMELTGGSENKPFECIGTLEEVNAALHVTIAGFGNNPLPLLLKRYTASGLYDSSRPVEASSVLEYWNPENNLSPCIAQLLKKALL